MEWVASHVAIASRSKVCPSAVHTGSAISSFLIGQRYAAGGVLAALFVWSNKERSDEAQPELPYGDLRRAERIG